MYGSVPTGLVALSRCDDPDLPPGSVGRAATGIEAEIVDERNAPLAAGEVGFLRVRGDAIATGFVNLPAESAERLVDGWCYTGDVASIDARGYIALHGRTTEILKVGGRSVFAIEIERVLAAHAAVAEAAVVGAPKADLEQEVVAFVVLRRPAEMRALVAHCRRELAPYKVPQRLYVIDEMPRNATQKVVKARLLELLAPQA
jgi:acyl-coenzyme A synthetase/AMP-(fatty) acid ligase